MKEKCVKDERLSAQVQKYGMQSFWIISIILLADVFYKAFIKNMELSSWIDNLLILFAVCLYFTIRCVLGGVFILPGKKENMKKVRDSFLVMGIMYAVVTLLINLIFNPNRYSYESEKDIIRLTLSTVLGFLVFIIIWFVMYLVSKKQNNKN